MKKAEKIERALQSICDKRREAEGRAEEDDCEIFTFSDQELLDEIRKVEH